MADKSINDLPVVESLADDGLLPVYQDGGAKRVSGEQLRSFAGMNITGATVGQIAKITAVDDTGKPTAWEAVDMPSGGVLTTAEKAAMLTLFQAAAYTSDVSATIAQLETMWSGGDIPDTPTGDISATGNEDVTVTGATATDDGDGNITVIGATATDDSNGNITVS